MLKTHLCYPAGCCSTLHSLLEIIRWKFSTVQSLRAIAHCSWAFKCSTFSLGPFFASQWNPKADLSFRAMKTAILNNVQYLIKSLREWPDRLSV